MLFTVFYNSKPTFFDNLVVTLKKKKNMTSLFVPIFRRVPRREIRAERLAATFGVLLRFAKGVLMAKFIVSDE